MNQTRLVLQAPEARAREIFRALESLSEEDGLPLSIAELDEAERLFEVALYTGEPDRDEERIRIAVGPGPALEISRESLPEIDWVAKSLEGLAPVRAGRFLIHGRHDRARRRSGDLAIEIEAGRAFGTGHHGTTAGCLALISEILRLERPAHALDLGTGSAVLAIAIARLGRLPVLATDNDPVAVEVARQNVRHNRVHRLVAVRQAGGFRHRAFAGRRFDLIVANILARPLVALAPAMARHLSPGGSLVLSGILATQRRAVLAAYTARGFRHVSTLPLEGWVSLHLKR